MGDTSAFGGDETIGTGAGGWMMGDTSEFGIVGCASVRAGGAGFSDFTAQSDARWRRSSWATMPKLLRENHIKISEVIQLTVPQTQEFL
jgi:hypothetical protein